MSCEICRSVPCTRECEADVLPDDVVARLADEVRLRRRVAELEGALARMVSCAERSSWVNSMDKRKRDALSEADALLQFEKRLPPYYRVVRYQPLPWKLS